MKTILKLPLLIVLVGPLAQGQTFTFSIGWRGPTLGFPASSPPGNLINEADILTFGPGAPGFGNLVPPSYSLDSSQLGLARYNRCLGHAPSDPCGIEVDAISQGKDSMLYDGSIAGLGPCPTCEPLGEVWFSVDEWAMGGGPGAFGADVGSESGSVGDASSDVFLAFGLGIGPIGPGGVLGRNAAVFDGNGLASLSGFVYPGIGLVEPNIAGVMPATGDNLDGLDLGATFGFPASGVYFSLDASFVDPIAPGFVNSGSAAAESKLPGDVLLTPIPGVSPLVFASAASLGLDLTGAGPGSDDLDALVLNETGDQLFQPSEKPYDWMDGTHDMLLFSVRRGSAVIGMPDSIFGAPIEAGDILTTPLPLAQGGLSVFPGIMFAAESLDLRTTRTNQVLFGDDLDALDFEIAVCFDCNNNGIEDAVDIATGASPDTDGDGVPDECAKALEYCYCPAPAGPCGNDSDDTGCGNSAGAGAHTFFMGTTSALADDLILTTTGIPPNKLGLYYMGGSAISLPLGDGLRCAGGGGVGVFRYNVQSSGPTGSFVLGPGMISDSCALFSGSGCISAGDTWYVQAWYRDPSGPCGTGFNFSNGMRLEFVP